MTAARGLRLDRNERLAPAAVLADALGSIELPTLARYPDAHRLEARIAAHRAIDPSRVLATAGGDDAIDRICRCGLRARPELVTVSPTFEMIPRFARLAGGRVVAVPSLDDPVPVERLIAATGVRTGVVAVISPHNPTGTATPAARLRRVAEGVPRGTIVLFDLAYVEFADDDPTPALLEHPNAVVVRTLSKAWGLAGLRVGYALGSPDVIRALRLAGAPFPLAGPSLRVAEAAVELGAAVTGRYVAAVRAERARLAELLSGLGGEPFPSGANFVFARIPDAERVWEGLESKGISVRRFDELPGFLRLTLPGDRSTFRRLTEALRAVMDPRTSEVTT